MNRIFLILILLPCLATAQLKNRLNSTDLITQGLKGQVKQVIEKHFRAAQYDNDSTYVFAPDSHSGPAHFQQEFNEHGNLKSGYGFEEVNGIPKVLILRRYFYDSKDRISKEQVISLHENDTVNWSYEYLDNSVINVKLFYSGQNVPDDKTTHILKGNTELVKRTINGSSRVFKKLYTYDKFDRIIRYEDYEDKDSIKKIKTKTYIDTISQNVYKEVNTSSKDYYQYDYDNNDNVIQITWGNLNDNSLKKFRFEYDYDKKGNWIEKRHLNEMGRLVAIHRREIEYYE